MNNYIKVKDHPGLVRDKQSTAILNTSKDDLAKYREERDQKMKLQQAVQDVAELKNDMAEIKDLLQQLLKK